MEYNLRREIRNNIFNLQVQNFFMNMSAYRIGSRIGLIFCLLIILLIPAGADAQTADDIINKYMDALGGKEKLQSIRTIYQEGVAVMGNGAEIDSKLWRVQGKLFRNEITMPMGNIVIIITPTQGWSSNPQNGFAFKELPAEAVKQMQGQLDCTSPLVDYAAKGNTVELVGKDTVNGHACYKLKVTMPSGQYVTYAIDAKTYYVLRETRKGGGMMGGGGGRRAGGDGEINIEYNDYQKTPDGYVFPFSIVFGYSGARTSVEKLEVNKPVDEAALSKPK